MAGTEKSKSPPVIDADLIAFFEDPGSYPHDPVSVEHIQTHISHVFIASPYVYKVKKPVNLDFLDFSTLEKRKYYCEQEVQLNRRLCPDIYLDVIPVYNTGGRFHFKSPGDGTVVEYVVWMKELESQYFMSEMIKTTELTRDHLDRVAEKLTPFYRDQQPDPEILEYGHMKEIKVNTDENFDQTEPFVGTTIDRASYKAVHHYTDAYLDKNEFIFEKRIEHERIVNGHGDLHLEHIHLSPGGVCIYDCIEFNKRFRYLDLAEDLAFLAMELDYCGYESLSRYFIQRMSENLDDRELTDIIDFYKCYRAYVRGKVKSMESSEEEISPEGRERAADTARHYFDLALKYALIGSGPLVIIFMGRVASGKSSMSRKLGERLRISRYTSDRTRKQIAGLPLLERPPDEVREKLYSPEMNEKTYSALYKYLEESIEKGLSVILDATFNHPGARKEVLDRVGALNVPYVFIETSAPDEKLKKRLKHRDEEGGSESDARLEDFEMLNERFVPPEELDRRNYIRVSTDQPVEDSKLELYNKLVDWNLDGGNS